MNKHFKDDDAVGVWIIWFIAALMVSLFLTITSSAEASSTMHLVDSYIDDGKGVKVCVYSDGRNYSYVERNRASTCPYTHIEY